MKVPEKIYAYISEDDIVGTASTKKGVPHQFVTTEYIRKDAFIEKAREGIKHLLSGYIIKNFNFGNSYEIDTLIEDFKKYMEKNKL